MQYMQSDAEFQEWVLGLQMTSSRRFTPEENREISKLVSSLWLKAYIPWIVFFTLTGLFILVESHAPPTGFIQFILEIWLIGLVMLGLPLSIVMSKDQSSRASSLSRDLKDDQLKVFSGRVNHVTLQDEQYPSIAKENSLNLGSPLSIEVMGSSGRVWSVNGQLLQRYVAVEPAKVAIAPDVGHQPAISSGFLSGNEDDLANEARKLTAAEKDEIAQHAKRQWTQPLPYAVGLTVWSSMPITVLIAQHHLNSLVDYIHAALLISFAAIALYRLFRGLRIAKLLSRYRTDGEVTQIVFPQADQDEAISRQDNIALPLERERLEILPSAAMVWTVNGSPAPWRLQR